MHYITRDKGNDPPSALPPHLPMVCLDQPVNPFFHPSSACVYFLPFPKLFACPAPEPASQPALGVQTFCSRQISIKEAGVGPAITFICGGLSLAVVKGKYGQAHVRGELRRKTPVLSAAGITGGGCLVRPLPPWRRLGGLKGFGVLQR